MAGDFDSMSEERSLFRPFTEESLSAIKTRRAATPAKKKNKNAKGTEDEGPQPNPMLEQGAPLPTRLRKEFPRKMMSTPLEDIDTFYDNQDTFVVISNRKDIHRFDATNALWILSPFNQIRRLAINISIHLLFSVFIMATIVVNCLLMVMPSTPTIESTELIFIGIFTLEVVIKVLARGFILKPFTYLRDPWNWLDFLITLFAWITLAVDLGDLGALRSIRVLRALKTLAIVPGMTTIGSVAMESIRNLRDVILLTIFSVAVFALLGLQIFMGVLTQKCVKNFPEDGSRRRFSNENWDEFTNNYTNWYRDDYGDIRICGNSSGAGMCDAGYTCLQGYGANPDYGYTTFDTYGWSLLSAFRLMTLDYWESLYRMILRSAGPWHIIYFIVTIFAGSIYLMNLFLGIIIVSYDKSQKKAEDNEAAEREAGRINQKDSASQTKQPDNGIIQSSQQNPSDQMTDVLALTDITVQTTGRPNEESDRVDSKTADRTVKGKVSSCIGKEIDSCCIWDCCQPWVKFQKMISVIVFDPFFELFITICIVVNTLFMAIDHHDMDRDMERVLKTGNYFFTATYFVEAILKIVAVSPKFYFKEGWNIFDFSIVVISICELGLEGVQGLSVLRCFRLLRVFRLAKSWSTFNNLISTMGKMLPGLGNLTFASFILMFIFSVIGMQLFGRNYIENIDRFPDEKLPRWNFTDFLHSYMLVFRILCGEWIETMWDCLLISDVTCVPFFLAVVVVGNLIVMNLGVAVLLSSICTANLSASTQDNETNKVAEAFGRLSRMAKWIKRCCCKDGKFVKSSVQLLLLMLPQDEKSDGLGNKKNANELNNQSGSTEISIDRCIVEHPADCCPNSCYKILPCLSGDADSSFWRSWANLRRKAFNLVENKYFEGTVLIVILISSICLALEDINLGRRPLLALVLMYLELAFAAIFTIEMLIKWLGLGFKKYFTSGWCWLDFIVVVASLLDFSMTMVGSTAMVDFHSLRILRALRPLRAASRCERLSVAVNAFVQAVRSIFNVMLVCLVFWLIFAIVGVQIFAGKFYKCVSDDETVNHEIVPDRMSCIDHNYTWQNSPMNFDHVGNAYLSLFQVATVKGWIRIMNDAVDSRDIHTQPIRETNIYMYFYFVIFIIFGSFFLRTLLMGVIINNFNERTKEEAGPLVMFMTENQKKRYSAMRKMGDKKPVKVVPRPTWGPQAFVFDLVTSPKFDITIMLIIGLNMLMMTVDHYRQAEALSRYLDYANLVFIMLYIIECVVKIFGLRHHYFKEPWNIFDFFVVVLSVLGLLLHDVVEKYFVSPTLLRVARVAKLGHVLRHVKSAKGIRTLLFTIKTTLPAIFNMCLLYFLVMFIYAVFGMSFFMKVRATAGIDDLFNFQTFGQSMLLLFQVSTLAGWDGVLDSLRNEDDCETPRMENDYVGDCGSAAMGTAYMLSFIIVNFFIFITMFIAIIMEIYSQAMKDVREGLTDSDYDMFYETWRRFDPEGSRYIKQDQLPEFLDALKLPLRIQQPNRTRIETMKIPVAESDRVFCGDVLDALVKDSVTRKGNRIDETTEINADEARTGEVNLGNPDTSILDAGDKNLAPV